MTTSNYYINKLNNYIDICVNSLNANNIITNDLSVNNITGIFKQYIDNSLTTITDRINNMENSTSLFDNSTNNIYNNYTNIQTNIDLIDISIQDTQQNIINNYYDKNIIDNSINFINSQINNIINNDYTFNSEKTFNDNITISGNLIGPNQFFIEPISLNSDYGNVIINGNLQVDGNTTTVKSSNIDISSKTIKLQNNELDNNSLEVFNNNGINPHILYDHQNSNWDINTNLDISGKLNIKDNDFRINTNNDLSDNKFEIILGENKTLFLDGNLEITGDFINDSTFTIYERNSKINVVNKNDIINDNVYSLYEGSSLSNFIINNKDIYTWGKNIGLKSGINYYGYNVSFKKKPYNEILNDNSNDMIRFLARYNTFRLDSVDFSYITPAQINDFFETSYNKIIVKQSNINYKLKTKINLDISLGQTFLGEYYIDFVLLKYENNSHLASSIIASIQKDISAIGLTSIDLSFNIEKYTLKKNQSIGIGFLLYNKTIDGYFNDDNFTPGGMYILSRTGMDHQVGDRVGSAADAPWASRYYGTQKNNDLTHRESGYKAVSYDPYYTSNRNYIMLSYNVYMVDKANASNIINNIREIESYSILHLKNFFDSNFDISNNKFTYTYNANRNINSNYIIKANTSDLFKSDIRIKGYWEIVGGAISAHSWSDGEITEVRERNCAVQFVLIKNYFTNPEILIDVHGNPIMYSYTSSQSAKVEYDFNKSAEFYLEKDDTISVGFLYFYIFQLATTQNWHRYAIGINETTFTSVHVVAQSAEFFRTPRCHVWHDGVSNLKLTSCTPSEQDITMNFNNINLNLEKNLLIDYESINIDNSFNGNNIISNDISTNNININNDFSCNILNIKDISINFNNLPIYNNLIEAGNELELWELWKKSDGRIYVNI